MPGRRPGLLGSPFGSPFGSPGMKHEETRRRESKHPERAAHQERAKIPITMAKAPEESKINICSDGALQILRGCMMATCDAAWWLRMRCLEESHASSDQELNECNRMQA